MYFQDDFKISPKLTINLGLRWEYDGPYSEANGQFASFNPTLTNRTTGTPGEVQFAGRNGAPPNFDGLYTWAPAFGGLILMALAAGAWLFPLDSGLLEFSEAEMQFLFPAPVSRRQLLIHRLLRSQRR